MKLNFLKKKKVYKKNRFKLSASSYWRIILGLFFLLLILAVFLGLNTYERVEGELVFSMGDTNNRIEKDKKNKVNEVLNYFKTREEKTKEILNSGSIIIDPSL
jgi:hypothetical protein